MLRANSQTTRLLIKERFNRALLDTLDHASHNIIEAKMRVCVSQVINRNHARLYLIAKRLQKQGYLMYDVVIVLISKIVHCKTKRRHNTSAQRQLSKAQTTECLFVTGGSS